MEIEERGDHDSPAGCVFVKNLWRTDFDGGGGYVFIMFAGVGINKIERLSTQQMKEGNSAGPSTPENQVAEIDRVGFQDKSSHFTCNNQEVFLIVGLGQVDYPVIAGREQCRE